ncbi:MAG: MFS transporter [Nitrospirota bacterium]|nr:MFS transporter [Nitrospirota bacterium]
MSKEIVAPPPVARREIAAWCFFDFANSAYTTLIITVAYSIYFTQVVAKEGGEQFWGWGYSASMLIIALISPVLGAVSDFSATKKRFLLFFTFICVIATGLMVFVKEGDVWLGIILLVISNIGFAGGITFYNAFLVEISDRDSMGRISGYGWAVGYVGGLLCLALAYPLMKGGFAPENLDTFRLSFLMTAAFFLVASLPTFLILKERARPLPLAPGQHYWGVGFKRVRETLREIRGFRQLTRYLIAYLIYTDGVDTVIVFAAIFATVTLKFTSQEVLIYFLVTQITAGIGAWVFGPITDRLGGKKTINITLLIWIGVVLASFLVQTKTQFYVIGLVAGIALGSNQAASRALLGKFIPSGRNAEFFGFFSLVGKFAATIGPIVYGEIAAATGSNRPAVLSIAAFFVIGLLLLARVNEPEGIEEARRHETA